VLRIRFSLCMLMLLVGISGPAARLVYNTILVGYDRRSFVAVETHDECATFAEVVWRRTPRTAHISFVILRPGNVGMDSASWPTAPFTGPPSPRISLRGSTVFVDGVDVCSNAEGLILVFDRTGKSFHRFPLGGDPRSDDDVPRLPAWRREIIPLAAKLAAGR